MGKGEVAVGSSPVEDGAAVFELDFDGAFIEGRDEQPREVAVDAEERVDIGEREGLSDKVD